MSQIKKKKDEIAEVEEKFLLHEIVLCKIRGSRYWPSRVIFVEGDNVQVEFLGDNRSV